MTPDDHYEIESVHAKPFDEKRADDTFSLSVCPRMFHFGELLLNMKIVASFHECMSHSSVFSSVVRVMHAMVNGTHSTATLRKVAASNAFCQAKCLIRGISYNPQCRQTKLHAMFPKILLQCTANILCLRGTILWKRNVCTCPDSPQMFLQEHFDLKRCLKPNSIVLKQWFVLS